MARLKTVRISGYRSIDSEVTVELVDGQPLVLVGENNAGKSNLVRALQLVLGPFWPGTHEPDDHEFFGRSRDHKIEIEIDFRPGAPLGGQYQRLVWRYDPLSEEPCYFRGRPGPFGKSEGYVSNDHRDSCTAIVLEAERNLSYHLSYSSKWTLLSRLMHRFHRALTGRPDVKAELERLFGQIKGTFQQIPEFAEFRGSLQSQIHDLVASMTHSLDVDFEAYNPANFFHALRLQALEGQTARALEEMGTGEQQVLAIAFAHAFARAFHGGLVLILEEPESHLHPLAQAWLARRLGEMCAGGLQLVLTTHSPHFVDLLALEGLVSVRKEDGKTQAIQVTRAGLAEHCVRLGASAERVTSASILPFYKAGATREILEGFFAKAVVLVEGPTEALALPVLLEKAGLEAARRGLAVIPVGGKKNLAKWWRLFRAFEIPCHVIFDNDAEDDRDERGRTELLKMLDYEEEEVAALLSEKSLRVGSAATVFGVDYERTLRAMFPSYAELEGLARASGATTKPLTARWVAEHLILEESAGGKSAVLDLCEVLGSMLPLEVGASGSAEKATATAEAPSEDTGRDDDIPF